MREDREDRETKGMGGPPPVAASPRYERVRVGRDAPPPSYRAAAPVVQYSGGGGGGGSRRCYVGNLAWQTAWQDLKDAFRCCGNIVYANVTKESDGRSAGWGIVEFETAAEAAQAIATMNNVDLGGWTEVAAGGVVGPKPSAGEVWDVWAMGGGSVRRAGGERWCGAAVGEG